MKRTGTKGFTKLCEFNYKYDYCPVSACLCQALGAPNPKPTTLNQEGFPAKRRSKNYSSLYSNAYNYRYYPEKYYSLTKQPVVNPIVSEFLPPACIKGTSRAGFESLVGLYIYACTFGFCPLHIYSYTTTGSLIKPPPQKPGFTRKPIGGINDKKLYNFACSRD